MSRLAGITLAAILIVAAIFAYPYTQGVEAAAPGNDDFYAATQITSLPFSDVVDIKDATIGQYDYVYEQCMVTPNKSVWYSFTPPATMAIEFNSAGSTFTPGLEVFTGTDYQNRTLMLCEPNLTKRDFTLSGGTTYYFMVFAPNVPYPGGEDLQWILNFSVTGLAAPNDEFADATVIGQLPFSETVDTRSATTGSGDPAPCGSPPYFSVWYQYTPAVNQAVQLSTSGSDYQTVIGVYSGSDLNNLTSVFCTTLPYSPTISLIGGVSYYFEVVANANAYPYPSGGVTGGTLKFELKAAPVANDNFETATVVSTFPFSFWYKAGDATLQPGEPQPSCGVSYPGFTTWYKLTPSQAGEITSYIHSFTNMQNDPYLFQAFYRGATLETLSEVACYKGASNWKTPLSANQTYWLQVGADQNNFFSWDWIQVDLGFYPKPANDDFAAAMLVSSLPFTNEADNSAATVEANEPASSCMEGDPIEHTVWYKFIPSSQGSVTTNTTAKYLSTYTAVYVGSDIAHLSEVACRWGKGYLTFRAQPGFPYFIQIGSHLGTTLKLDLFVPPPPAVDFGWTPVDASIFDKVQFCDSSSDPVGSGFVVYAWSFGAESFSNTKDVCVWRQFCADGSVTVCHKATTYDGRDGTTCKQVLVKTHDVAITKFLTPKSARVGQTAALTVGVQNTRYAETVQVDLYKVTPSGDVFVSTQTQAVPVMAASLTKDFKFYYKFTAEDATVGQVTFKAVATILNARDAKPENNTAKAASIRVTR